MDRAGPYMQTVSGRRFYLLDPRPEDIVLKEAAHALSNICRFGGHTKQFYAVAQHCHLVADLVPPRLELYALLDDLEEAYTGDMIEPMQRALRQYTSAFTQIRDGIKKAVLRRFRLPPLSAADEALVRHADLVALATERRDLMVPTTDHWEVLDGIEPHEEEITPYSPGGSYLLFLDRFAQLQRRRA